MCAWVGVRVGVWVRGCESGCVGTWVRECESECVGVRVRE